MEWDIGPLVTVYSCLTARSALFLSCTSRRFRETLRNIPENMVKEMWLEDVFSTHPSHQRPSSTLPSLDLYDRCYLLTSDNPPLLRRIELATRRVRLVDEFIRREESSSGAVAISVYATALTVLERELDEHMVQTMSLHPITSLCVLHALARSKYRVRSSRKPDTENDVQLVYFLRGHLGPHAPFRSRDRRLVENMLIKDLRELVCNQGLRLDADPNGSLSQLDLLDKKCWMHAISGLMAPSLRLR